SWPPPWDPSTASRPQPLGAPVCLLAGCALGNCWCSAQAEECKRWQPGKGTRGTGGGRAGRESGNGNRQGGTVHARGRPPCRRQALRARRARRREPGRELACRARQPSVAARLSAQGPRSSRGPTDVRATRTSEVSCKMAQRPWIARRSPRPRAARGGGSRTAGSRQTSRTAPGARVQRASSDPRGTTQPARALHNARDADEMVMAE
ncbi:unnamed protein product, partial [Prorocentrum cordatum]